MKAKIETTKRVFNVWSETTKLNKAMILLPCVYYDNSGREFVLSFGWLRWYVDFTFEVEKKI